MHYIAFDKNGVVTNNGIIRPSDVERFAIFAAPSGGFNLIIHHRDKTVSNIFSEDGMNFYLD